MSSSSTARRLVAAAALLSLVVIGVFVARRPKAPEGKALRRTPQRVFVMGFDGLDPTLARQYMDEGKLPHLKKLAEEGTFATLGSTQPSESPTAWSSFATGVNPGKHNIYDFLVRDLQTYMPDLGMVKKEPPEFLWGTFPTKAPKVTSTRGGTSFWVHAGQDGVKSVVLTVPITFPPEEVPHGELLGGLPLPDIRGTVGTFYYWASDLTSWEEGNTEFGGYLKTLLFDGGTAETFLKGPENPILKQEERELRAKGKDQTDQDKQRLEWLSKNKDVTLPMKVRWQEGSGQAEVEIQGQTVKLKAGEWSDWVPLTFKVNFLIKLHGMTKFYVVNDATTNRTYEYDALGGAIENYAINSGNSAPRGAASNVAGDKVWVADKNRKVYVYNPSGGLLASWSAGTLASNATVEGLATNGTDVWIVDSRSDKVYRYSGAASRTTGSQTAVSSFSLNSGNTSPKGIVTDGTHLWVVNDSSTDKVFKYTLNGTLVGSWTIDSTNKLPTGLTIDPSGGSQSIWIVDSGTDKVYEYANARAKTSGSQSASATFSLAAGNTNPQGIADPPSSVANVQQANTAAAPVATSNVSIPSPAAIDLALAQLPADFVRKQSDSTFVTDRYQRGDHEVSLAKPLAMNGVVSLTTQQSTRLAQSEQRTAPQSKRTTSTTAGREAFAANVDSLFADEASLMP